MTPGKDLRDEATYETPPVLSLLPDPVNEASQSFQPFAECPVDQSFIRTDNEGNFAAKGKPALERPVQPNPYRVPEKVVPGHVVSDDTNLEVPPASRARITLWAIVYFYPVWLVASFYLTWLVAWIQLGHHPRPMLDDPKSIGGWMDLVYPIPGMVAMAMPILAPLGFVAAFFYPVKANRGDRYTIRTALALFYIALSALTLVWLRADVGRVVEWWFD